MSDNDANPEAARESRNATAGNDTHASDQVAHVFSNDVTQEELQAFFELIRRCGRIDSGDVKGVPASISC